MDPLVFTYSFRMAETREAVGIQQTMLFTRGSKYISTHGDVGRSRGLNPNQPKLKTLSKQR